MSAIIPIIAVSIINRNRRGGYLPEEPPVKISYKSILMWTLAFLTVAVLLPSGLAILFDHIQPKSYEIARSTNQYQVVHFDPPKHVYVSLKQVNTGTVYNNVYVSKHFNHPSPINKVFTLVLVEYRRTDGVLWCAFENLNYELRK